MRVCIKSFLEVQDKYAVIQDFGRIVYNSDQLSFTAVPLSECMLTISPTSQPTKQIFSDGSVLCSCLSDKI